MTSCPVLCSGGRNQIAIRFNRYLNRNEYSIKTLRYSIQVPCDLILIRFKF